jgi:PAS domain S-box-containing protein
VDITDRKLAEENLRISEGKYRVLAEQSIQGLVVVKGEPLEIVFANEAIARLIGATVAEVRALPVEGMASFLHPEDRRILSDYYRDRMAGNPMPDRYEFRVITRGGDTIWVEVLPKKIEWEGGPAVLAAVLEVTDRHRAQEALRKSEVQYRTTIDSMLDGIHVVDQELRIVLCNERLLKWNADLGLPGEIVGRDLFEIYPFLEESHREEYARVLRDGASLASGEVTILGGKRVFTQVLKIPVVEDGVVTRVVTVVRDVTAGKLGEEALRESEERFKAIFDNAMVGIYRTTPDGRILLANPALVSMLGYSSFDDLTSRNLEEEGYEPEYPRSLFKERIESEGKIRGLQATWTGRDGAPLMVRESAWAFRDGEGRTLFYEGTVEDITVREKAVEALEASEEKYSRLYHETNDAIIVHDLEGKIQDVNRKAVEQFGYTRPEILAMRIPDLHPPEAASISKRAFETIEKEGRVHFEVEFKRKNGDVFPAEVSASLFDLSGTPVIQGIVRDVTDRHRAQAALEASEDLFRTLAESTAAGIFIYRGENYIYVNPSASLITGYSLEEFGTMKIWDVIHPDHKNMVRDRAVTRQEGAETLEGYEVQILTKSGESKWIDYRAARIQYRGAPAVLGTVFDITARREAEQALRESEEKFKILAEESPNMIFISREGRVVYANPRCSEIMGYTREEFLSEEFDFLVLVDPDYRDAIAKRMKAHLEGKEVPVFEYRLVTRGGHRLDALLDSKIIEYEGEPAVLGTILDMTERKRSEAALRESEEKYRTLVDLSPDPVVILQDRIFKFANPAFSLVFGYGPEEVEKGLTFSDLVQGEDLETVRKQHEDRLAGKPVPRNFHLGIRCKDGTLIPCETSASRILFNDRPADLVVIRDISERQRAEEERRKLENQLQHAQKLESLGVLAGGIAHDFNNLLTGVLGNADLALLELKPENPGRPFLEEIRVTSKRLADLTRQMLAYSGKGRFVVEPIDLCLLVKEMTHLLQVSISKNVEVRYDFQNGLPLIEADATQIRQVVMNLITNASESMGDTPGFISVRLHAQRADRALLSGTYLDEGLPEGLYVSLEVSDSGSGMDDETRSRIFDPFFSTKFTGRGLGLAAVLGIVRGHRGAITVRSEQGKGTTFTVLLPATDSSGVPIQPTAKLHEGPYKGSGTVLVVDDDRTVRSVAKVMLEKAGYSCHLATGGQEALDFLADETENIDMVLLDLTMPKMSGATAFTEVKKLRPHVPIILVSGYAEEDALEQFGSEGLSGFIQKPFEARSFLGKIDEVMKASGGGAAS